MKSTRYFREQVMIKRPYLREEWITEVLREPVSREVQEGGRIRHWGFVEELDRHLRVVTLSDGETVHNAFPERNFKGSKS